MFWVGIERAGVCRNIQRCVVSCQTAANEQQENRTWVKVFPLAHYSWDELYAQSTALSIRAHGFSTPGEHAKAAVLQGGMAIQ